MLTLGLTETCTGSDALIVGLTVGLTDVLIADCCTDLCSACCNALTVVLTFVLLVYTDHWTDLLHCCCTDSAHLCEHQLHDRVRAARRRIHVSCAQCSIGRADVEVTHDVLRTRDDVCDKAFHVEAEGLVLPIAPTPLQQPTLAGANREGVVVSGSIVVVVVVMADEDDKDDQDEDEGWSSRSSSVQ